MAFNLSEGLVIWCVDLRFMQYFVIRNELGSVIRVVNYKSSSLIINREVPSSF